jgi:hypothetical protein
MRPDKSPLNLFDATPVGSWIAVAVVVGLLFFVVDIARIGEGLGRLIGEALAGVFVAATVAGAFCVGVFVIFVLIVIATTVHYAARDR